MNSPLLDITEEQVAAAQLRVVLDEKLGRSTPMVVRRIAAMTGVRLLEPNHTSTDLAATPEAEQVVDLPQEDEQLTGAAAGVTNPKEMPIEQQALGPNYPAPVAIRSSEFLHQLAKGQVRKGRVSSIVNFGAVVDLGGVDGLVHVSELSWKRIDHPSEVVEVGQEVTVEVLDVDLDRERVSLSLKATQEDPWRQFARTHQIGQIVPGKVTKLVPFGSFVRVEEGIEGLVHISELSQRHVEIPEQVVQVGGDVMVKVIDIDVDRRRISLSLKQANEDLSPEMEFDPTQYGMTAEYDSEGNYIYPEGFDPETNDWLEGYDKQRQEWERAYAEAQVRFEQHRKQIIKAVEAKSEAADDRRLQHDPDGHDGAR